MQYTGAVCFLASLFSFLNWKFNVEDFAGRTHLPPELEAAQFILFYFMANALFMLFAYDLVSKLRIRWHTVPLRRVLFLAILLQVCGGVAYGLGLEYEFPFTVGLVVLTIAEILCFFGPSLHRRYGYHNRLRRHLRAESDHGSSPFDWAGRNK